jgi:hypothetical protein
MSKHQSDESSLQSTGTFKAVSPFSKLIKQQQYKEAFDLFCGLKKELGDDYMETLRQEHYVQDLLVILRNCEALDTNNTIQLCETLLQFKLSEQRVLHITSLLATSYNIIKEYDKAIETAAPLVKSGEGNFVDNGFYIILYACSNLLKDSQTSQSTNSTLFTLIRAINPALLSDANEKSRYDIMYGVYKRKSNFTGALAVQIEHNNLLASRQSSTTSSNADATVQPRTYAQVAQGKEIATLIQAIKKDVPEGKENSKTIIYDQPISSLSTVAARIQAARKQDSNNSSAQR